MMQGQTNMFGFDPNTFGALNADTYDATQDPGTTDQAVALIAEVAQQGTLLELASGTGRITIPLAQKGFQVTGIEASPEMVAKMHAKPGGADIPVVIGDMADVAVDGPFDNACLIYNTLFNLPDQESQVRLFKNTAKVLRSGGTFLLEMFVPKLDHFQNNQMVQTKQLDMQSLVIEACQHDPVAQTFQFQRVHFSPEGTKLVPFPMRYAYPPELDLMARLAGLRLKHRWSGWHKGPFTADSSMHISVYEKL
jgi:SAM-dependent methyltransferase